MTDDANGAEGIWAHGHWPDKDGNPVIPPFLIYSESNLGTFDWIQFRGASRTIHRPIEDIRFDPTRGNPDSLLIQPTTFSLSSIGEALPSRMISRLSDLPKTQPASFAFVPGNNSQCTDWNCIRLGQGFVTREDQANGYYTLIVPGGGLLASVDESGGGVFANGMIIGVNAAIGGDDLIFTPFN